MIKFLASILISEFTRMIRKNTKVNWTVKDIVLNLEFIRTQDESPHEGILIIHD